MFFNAVLGFSYWILEAAAKTKLILLNTTICLVINIILNILFIPKFGVAGAAIATATTLCLHDILSVIQIFKLLKIKTINFKNVKTFILGLVTVIISRLLYVHLANISPIMQLIIEITVSFILYIIGLPLINFFEAYDKIVIKQIETKLRLKIPFISSLIAKKWYFIIL